MMFDCEECGVECTSQLSLDSHLASKRHQRIILLQKLSCDVCGVHCMSQKSFDQHLASKKHKKQVEQNFSCALCNVKAKNEKEFQDHLRSKNHLWEEALRKRVADTMKDLETLYQKAMRLLDNAGVDIEKCGVNGLSKKLRKLGLGSACITCLQEFSIRELRIHLLETNEDHIYSKKLLKAEKHRVLGLLGESSEDYTKAKLVFAVKNALLIRLYGR